MMADTPEPCQAEKCSEQRTESVLVPDVGRGLMSVLRRGGVGNDGSQFLCRWQITEMATLME